MILAPNHQQQLNGNSLFYILVIFSFFTAACTPKVIQTPPVVVKPVENKEKTAVAKPIIKNKQATIALLIPFKLADYNLQTITKSQIEKADLALDFYQGVMMGIDSAAKMGTDFKVNVFDTEDNEENLLQLIKKPSIKESDLLIGPIFPSQIKLMTNYAIANDMPIISPLAASKPADFKNPKLISISNDIEVHAEKIATYIGENFHHASSIVVLINTQKTAGNAFAQPIKGFLAKKYPALSIQEYNSTSVFETKMQKGKKYAVVICSDDSRFVSTSIGKLYKLKNNIKTAYPIQLFGHPNWVKQNYNIEQLQNLKTVITSSYYIDYKSKRIIDFIKNYRDKYRFEPSEYAFKGFDIAYYFTTLMVKHEKKYLDYVLKDSYQGLHNNFKFAYHPNEGYFNTYLQLLTYKNLTLKLIEE